MEPKVIESPYVTWHRTNFPDAVRVDCVRKALEQLMALCDVDEIKVPVRDGEHEYTVIFKSNWEDPVSL